MSYVNRALRPSAPETGFAHGVIARHRDVVIVANGPVASAHDLAGRGPYRTTQAGAWDRRGQVHFGPYEA
jgi:hypothetical protein